MTTVESLSPVMVTQGTPSVFQHGRFPTTIQPVSDEAPPPKPVIIVTPTVEGSYPVVLFFHGFLLQNTYYTDLLTHVASHGYIIVAPQLYKLPPGGQEEVNDAGRVTSWCKIGLQTHLPDLVTAELEKVALAGHSRGGKTAFAVALGLASPTVSLTFSSLIAVDPVAGPSRCLQTEPKILTYQPRSLDLRVKVAVIGTGLGPDMKIVPPMPPCAPKGMNHVEFFHECKPPCAHFVAADYGHMDMLDDDLPGAAGLMAGCICKNGREPKEPMRKCVGGIIVAFLKYSIFEDKTQISTIVEHPSVSPARLYPAPQFIES